MNSPQLPPRLEGRLNPELVSAVVTWLVHEDCPANGEIFAAGGGYVAQAFIGLTRGTFAERLTAEEVRDRFEEIRDREGFREPTSPSDEFFDLVARLGIDDPFTA